MAPPLPNRIVLGQLVLPVGLARAFDDQFVEPDHISSGAGRPLIEDAAERASEQGAEALEVTVGPAQGFYERLGFNLIAAADTRFGPAVRMRRDLHDARGRVQSETRPAADVPLRRSRAFL